MVLLWRPLLFCLLVAVVRAEEEVGVDLGEHTVFAVNCGGNGHRGSQGIYYEQDTLNVGTASDHGHRYAFVNAYSLDVPLYQTERWSDDDFSYSIPLEDNGGYVLILKFSEVYFTKPKRKIFDVLINNMIVLRNLDIYKETRRVGFALDYYIDLNVRGHELHIRDRILDFDGTITITFAKGLADNPKVNAIALVKGNSAMLLPEPKGFLHMDETIEEDDVVEEWTPAPSIATTDDDEELEETFVSGSTGMENPFENKSNLFWYSLAITAVVVACAVIYQLCFKKDEF